MKTPFSATSCVPLTNIENFDGRDLNLMPTTEEHAGLNSTTTTLLAEVAASDRMDVFDQATLLGVELLRGGKPNLVHKS